MFDTCIYFEKKKKSTYKTLDHETLSTAFRILQNSFII